MQYFLVVLSRNFWLYSQINAALHFTTHYIIQGTMQINPALNFTTNYILYYVLLLLNFFLINNNLILHYNYVAIKQSKHVIYLGWICTNTIEGWEQIVHSINNIFPESWFVKRIFYCNLLFKQNVDIFVLLWIDNWRNNRNCSKTSKSKNVLYNWCLGIGTL